MADAESFASHYDIMDLFEEMSFTEKWQRVGEGLKQHPETGEYKWAKYQILRLWFSTMKGTLGRSRRAWAFARAARRAISYQFVGSLCLLAAGAGTGYGQQVVINEIHSDPDIKTELVEFVELFNEGASQVDLSGWHFSGGMSYTFPTNTLLAGNAYLIVAGTPQAISNKFGKTAYGPWLGQLNNDGDSIVLRNALGDKRDEVTYGLGFPWPTVGDLPGRSMQLLNPALDNDLGGSWRSALPTPCASNSVFLATNRIPPQIRQVAHSPLQPASGVQVLITAKVTDSQSVAAVTLHYQSVDPGNYIASNDTAYATNWLDLPMNDGGINGDSLAGDGIFTCLMTSSLQVHRRLVRYRITARDALTNSVTVPYSDDPQRNFAYFVYDGVPAWTGAVNTNSALQGEREMVVYDTNVMRRLPVYHLIGKTNDISNATWFERYTGRDYKWPGTLVYDGVVYDHIRFRARGAGHRYDSGKNMWKFDFNRGHSFSARDNHGNSYRMSWQKLNLNSTIANPWYEIRGHDGMFEAVGHRLFNLAGVPAPKTHWIQFRVIDGAVESGPTQYDGDFWGLYLAVEQPDGRFLDEHGLPDGNLYKMEGGSGTLNNQGPTAVTNSSDLKAFMAGYQSYPPAGWWRTNVDIECYFSYRTIVDGIHHYDISYGGKNYFYYLNPVPVTNQWGTNFWWSVVPWDLDLSWHEDQYDGGDGGLSPFKRYGLWDKAEMLIERRNRVREIRDLLYNTNTVWALIDEYAAIIVPSNGAPSIVDADRSLWDYSPFSALPYAKSDNRGRFFKKVVATGSFAGVVQLMKNCVADRGTKILDPMAADADIPHTPTALATTNVLPVNDAVFTCSAFSDPQGNGTFAAMEWRAGEVTDTNSPTYDPKDAKIYECQAVWESGEIASYAAGIKIPSGALAVGHRYRVRVRMKDNTGRWSHWSDCVEFIASLPNNESEIVASLRVSELMYNSAGGDDKDFVEFRNTSGTMALDVSGVRISQGVEFSIPDNTTIAPGGYLVVSKSSPTNNFEAFRTYYGLPGSVPVVGSYSGKLDNAGETITVKSARAGTVFCEFTYGDGRGWPLAADGAGHSLVPLVTDVQTNGALDYGGNWRASAYRDGSPGRADPEPVTDVVLNEIMAHTDFTNVWDSNDWIEFYNKTNRTVNFTTNWFLSDDPEDLKKWMIPGTNSVVAGGWITFFEQTGFHNPTNIGFGLSKAGDAVYLSYLAGSVTDRVVDCVSFKAQANFRAWGRYPDGASRWYTTLPTTNKANALATNTVVINEVMYHPATNVNYPLDNGDVEYVELYNAGAGTVTLTNEGGACRVSGGVSYVFPINTTIPAGGYLALVSFDPSTNLAARASFLAYYGLTNGQVRLMGPFSGRLSDGGDRVALEFPLLPDLADEGISWGIMDEVYYADRTPWPEPADGEWASLSRLQSSGSGNEPANWLGGTPTPGKINGTNAPPVIAAPLANIAVTVGQTATFAVTATGTAPLYYQWYTNNAAIGGATASSYTTPASTANDSGKQFKVTVTNAYGAVTSSVATLTVNAVPTGGVYATGGTITNYTQNGTNWTAHIFTNSGTLTVTIGGDVEVLVVAGGGGGGRSSASGAGGGGAGGFVYSNVCWVAAGSHAVVVGAGGAGKVTDSGSGMSGSDSSFGTITALGGGYGGNKMAGGIGGSGGGGGSAYPGGLGASGQGMAGGGSVSGAGGGGGGAGTAGGNASSGVGGNGGAGLASDLSGAAIYYAGGGGGGATAPGAGGAGGGGNGAYGTTPGNGIAGTGGGGGGTMGDVDAGAGGSGIVIVRYVKGGGSDPYQTWRGTYFTAEQLTNTAVSGDSADPDHDGLSNQQEYLAGTNPTNPASRLAFTKVEPDATRRRISWQSASGKVYQVLTLTNLLQDGPGQILATNITGGTYLDTNPPTPALYYRLRLEQ